jgi:ElaB/YqjD/DUF883 family membrane-anchored ribosome-binding protein
MGEDSGAGRASVEPADPDEIRAAIEQTREELGETVAALSAKTDIKAQAKARIEETKAGLQEKREQITGKAREISPESAVAAASSATDTARRNPLPLAVAGAFVAGLVFGRLLARRDS